MQSLTAFTFPTLMPNHKLTHSFEVADEHDFRSVFVELCLSNIPNFLIMQPMFYWDYLKLVFHAQNRSIQYVSMKV